MTDNITIEEIQRRHDERVALEEAEKKERDERFAKEVEEMGGMSMHEYIAKREGREYKQPDDLGELSMEEYIKYRSGK